MCVNILYGKDLPNLNLCLLFFCAILGLNSGRGEEGSSANYGLSVLQ
jgi:hypothetical protein